MPRFVGEIFLAVNSNREGLMTILMWQNLLKTRRQFVSLDHFVKILNMETVEGVTLSNLKMFMYHSLSVVA